LAGKGRNICFGETLTPKGSGRSYAHREVQVLQDHLSPVTAACSKKSSNSVKHQHHFPSAQEDDTSLGVL